MTEHGHHNNDTAVTNDDIEVMADEAEVGYDVEAVLRRRSGRPAIGSAPASASRSDSTRS